jgi:photosystem II stability/assembly factor-like uncharacterized protein
MGPVECQFVDENTIYIGIDDGSLTKSGNGGASWQEVFYAGGYGIRGVDFLSPDTGWIAARTEGGFWGGFIARTYNGGITWDTVLINGGVEDIDMISKTTGYAVASGPADMKMFSTHDSGNSWQLDTVLPSGKGQKLFFPNQYVGYCIGNGPGYTDVYKLDLGIGIDEKTLTSRAEITLMPNPAAGNIHIQLSGCEPDECILNVMIVNCLGKVLIDKQLNCHGLRTSIDLSSLDPGIYFTCVRTNKGSETVQRFIRIK